MLNKMDLDDLLKSVKLNLSFFHPAENIAGKILDAMRCVDRKYFVRKKEFAYLDIALSIGYNQTISQPSTVASMLLIADLKPGENVLEIGAGSGWNACLAGFMVYPGKILSLDIIPELIERANNNRNELKKNISQAERLSGVEFRHTNILTQIDSWDGKYDKIIITAGIRESQEATIDKLAKRTLNENGTLVCPYINGPLMIMKRINGKIMKHYSREKYVFVPLLN